jgi:glyoxylase-like metal-dependent hydrolase (beta-lactamase superfamily II)
MNHVNCFAIKGADGWHLIDAGLKLEEDQETWQRFFAEHAITPSDILGIYITHFHPDHYGGAGWLQNYAGGAPVYMGAIEAARVGYYWERPPGATGVLHTLFQANGMPEDVWAEVITAFGKVVSGTAPPHAKLTVLETGGKVRLGDHEYQVMLISGHSDGHICFYNEAYGVFLAGDNLLPEINISLWKHPPDAADPLNNFFHSLHGLRTLDCQLILSGHGRAFQGITERVDKIEAHHRDRSALLKSYVGDNTTAYHICRQAYRPDISAFELRFAMAETLAHLTYLTFRDELATVTRDDGVIGYRRKA